MSIDNSADPGKFYIDSDPQPIPTYLSHSYRPEDRAVNQFVHDICWDHGFAFTVDPQAGPVSTTCLEMMMRRIACFLAVGTRRDEQPRYRCSPFMVYEYGLAVLAQKPRLVLLERGVSGLHFPEQQHTVVFDRSRLRASVPEIRAKLDQLAAESRAYVNIGNRALGEVGLLLPKTPQHREAGLSIKRVLDDAGYTPRDLNLTDIDSATAAGMLDRLDFVVVDIGAPNSLSELIPFVQGRFIPSVKLIFHRPGQYPPVQIPRLLSDRALETAGTASEVAIWWSSIEELERKLQKRMLELSVPRREFMSKAEGESYFLSLGQSRGPVFVSNANADNELARNLVGRLRSYNILPFHYRYENSIPLGADWKSMLPRKIAESSVFMPLISQAYWESEYCKQEFDTAVDLHRQGLIKFFPCFLSRTDGPEIDVQGISLADLDSGQRIERIVAHLDRELLYADRPAEVGLPMSAGESPVSSVDIAILTALPEEYEAVYQQLENPQRVISTETRPNRYSWVTATITSETQGQYRVLLALSGTGTESALLAARNTADAFRPDSVLLVGVAGAVDGRLHPGDVVVSDRIFGYEYGKVNEGFHPRPDLSFPTDQSVASAARTMATRHRDWDAAVATPPPSPTLQRPQILVGPVASGSKVVDNLGDSSFAPVLRLWPKLVAVEMEALGSVRAVDDARERGCISHFAMIRGISDCPITSTDTDDTHVGSGANQTAQRDQWKTHAAAVAASFTVRLVQTSWPRPPRQRPQPALATAS